MKSNKPMWIRLFHWLVILVVVVVAIAGLIVSGSPSDERARRLDEQRVNHLESIANGIDQYWDANEALPDSLTTLQESRNVFIQTVNDPETGEMYVYERTGEKTYQLCATFSTATDSDDRSSFRGSRFWNHGPGHACFPLEALDTNDPKPIIVR